jgi:hypothetical protein
MSTLHAELLDRVGISFGGRAFAGVRALLREAGSENRSGEADIPKII